MRVCHFLTNPYSFDNRVKKECEHLVDMGFDVYVIGMARGNEFPASEVMNGVKVFRIDSRVNVFSAVGRFLKQAVRAVNSSAKRGSLMSKLLVFLLWFYEMVKKVMPFIIAVASKGKRVLFYPYNALRAFRTKLSRKVEAQKSLDSIIASEISFSFREKLIIAIAIPMAVVLSPVIILLVIVKLLVRAVRPLGAVVRALLRRVLYLEKAFELQADVYQANDWDTLGVTYLASKVVGSEFVYDAHELYDESFPRRKHLFKRAYIRATEGFFTRRAKEVISVSHEISRILKERYALKGRPTVVRNVQKLLDDQESSHISSGMLFHKIGKQPGTKKLVAYTGKITNGRGLEELIRSSLLMRDEAAVIIMGPSDELYKQYLIDLAKELGLLNERVFVLDAVSPAELPFILKDVYIGVVSTPTEVLSYYYGLSNKMFSYVQAGVPIVSIDHPEKRRFIDGNKVGVLIPDNGPESISIAVNELIDNPELRDKLHENCRVAAQTANWQNEVMGYENVYVRMYENLLFGEVVTSSTLQGSEIC